MARRSKLKRKAHKRKLTKRQLRAIHAKGGRKERNILGRTTIVWVAPRNSKLVGKSNKAKDKRIRALHPGKRRSKSGKVYYEHRANRSDKSRTLRL